MNTHQAPQRFSLTSKPSVLFTLVLFALTLLLGSISINQGLKTDDYVQQRIFLNEGVSGIHHLYSFFEPGSKDFTAKKVWGAIPWWANEDLTIHFWRPLSALSHWLDFQILPDESQLSTKLMHLHNMFWYSLLVLCSLFFFRNIFSSSFLAILAAFIFCIDFTNMVNISWLASRNTLITSCFCLLSITYHIKWRNPDTPNFTRVINSLFAILFFLCALLSSESGINTVGFLIAYSLFISKEALRTRFSILLPYLSIGLIWLMYYHSQGYGIANSRLYLHPIDNFAEVVTSTFIKLPIYLFGQLFIIEGFFNVLADSIKPLVSAACLGVVAVFLFLFRDFLKNDANFRFFLVAGIISLLPSMLFAMGDTRLFLSSSVAFAGVITICLGTLFQRASRQKNLTMKIFSIYLLLAHVVFNLIQWSYAAYRYQFQYTQDQTTNVLKPRISSLEKYSVSNKRLVLLNSPSIFDYYYLSDTFRYLNKQIPQSIHLLNSGIQSFDLLKTDSRTLELTLRESDTEALVANQYAKDLLNRVYQEKNFELSQGQHYQGNGFVVKVMQTKPQLQLSFLFKDSLSPDQYTILVWNKKLKDYQTIDLQLNTPFKYNTDNDNLNKYNTD